MLSAARKAGIPIPTGEIPAEGPDFRFDNENPPLGIELSEVLRPATSNHGILPVEQESFHKDIITKAQHAYYDALDVRTAHVSVFFTDTKGVRRDKSAMANALAEFVRTNVRLANPFVSLYRPETPDGFDSVVISGESRDWWCGEGGTTRLTIYGHNLPLGSATKTGLFRSIAPTCLQERKFGCLCTQASPWPEA